MNYFTLLEIEKKYNIDYKILNDQYLQKQILYHPDKAGNTSLRTKHLQISMELNEAYKVLNDDYSRAKYLLTLAGQRFDNEFLKSKISQSELENIMSLYEIIDSAEDITLLQSLEEQKIAEKDNLLQDLAKAFDSNITESALHLTVRLKYINNILKNLQDKLSNLAQMTMEST